MTEENQDSDVVPADPASLEKTDGNMPPNGMPEGIPKEFRKTFEMMISSQRLSGPQPPPFADKINESHLTSMIMLQKRKVRGNSLTRDQPKGISSRCLSLWFFCFFF